MTMTHISLFSGIGGFDLAAQWAGFETVLFCEKDAYCQKVLRRHWPGVPIHADIHDLDGTKWQGATLLTGGFPCQPFSVAGKRGGETDDRFLWPEMLRVIRESRPRWLAGENVPGIINVSLDRVCTDLEDLGYEVGEPLVFPAASLGAPHKRERVFVVATNTGSDGRGAGWPRGFDSGGAWQPEQTLQTMADAISNGEPQSRRGIAQQRERPLDRREVAPHATSERLDGAGTARSRGNGSSHPRLASADTDEQGSQGYGRLDSERGGAHQWLTWSGSRPLEGAGVALPYVRRVDDELSSELDGGRINGDATQGRPDEVLRGVRGAVDEEEIQRGVGKQAKFSSSEVLQRDMHGERNDKGESDPRRVVLPVKETTGRSLRGMRGDREIASSSCGYGPVQQRSIEPDDLVRLLSSEMALGAWQDEAEATVGLQNLRNACAEIGHVPEALSTLQEVWRSLSDEEKYWIGLRISSGTPWIAEWPHTPRLATGVKNRVARLRSLGNAVVPQTVYPILLAIAAYERRNGHE